MKVEIGRRKTVYAARDHGSKSIHKNGCILIIHYLEHRITVYLFLNDIITQRDNVALKMKFQQNK